MITYFGGGVLLEECLAVFGQSVSDRSASSCLNERVDTIVQFASELSARIRRRWAVDLGGIGRRWGPGSLVEMDPRDLAGLERIPTHGADPSSQRLEAPRVRSMSIQGRN